MIDFLVLNLHSDIFLPNLAFVHFPSPAAPLLASPKGVSFYRSTSLTWGCPKAAPRAPLQPFPVPWVSQFSKTQKTPKHRQMHGPYFVFKHAERCASSWVGIPHHSPSPSQQERGSPGCSRGRSPCGSVQGQSAVPSLLRGALLLHSKHTRLDKPHK